MKEHFWLKPLSVLLGVFAWFFVNIVSSSPIIREFKVKIIYLNNDDSKHLKIIPEAPEAIIKVKGPRGVFIQTKVEENTFASVDLINCHGGKLTLPVNVNLPSNSSLQLVSKEPAQLVLNAITMVTKDIKVKAKVIGSVPEGYLSSEPIVSPKFLSVTAPSDVIDTIEECRLDVYLDEIRRSISEYRQTHIVYKNGMIESNLNNALIDIANNNVKIDVAVKEGYPEKTVSVRPNLLNRTPEGRKLENCIVLPEKVSISGPSRLLEKIKELRLEPFDLSSINKSTTVSLKADCPNGVFLTGQNSFDLTLRCSDVIITKTIKGLPLEFTHDEDQLVECDVSSYSLIVEGIIDDLNAIKPSEIMNIICVKGLASGTHDVELSIPYGFSDRITVKNIIPQSLPVTVNILEKIEPTLQENSDVLAKEVNQADIASFSITEIGNNNSENYMPSGSETIMLTSPDINNNESISSDSAVIDK